MTGVQFVIEERYAAHLAAALTLYVRRASENGIRAPEELVSLAKRAAMVADGFSSPLPSLLADDVPVKVLLSLPDVAAELDCSLSKVKNLVAAGHLQAVDFDGVRVRRSDLETYVEGLGPRRLADKLEAKAVAPRRQAGSHRPTTSDAA